MTLTWGEAQRARIQRIASFRNINWWAITDDSPVIAPGTSMEPFSFKTTARPGIVRPFFQGAPGMFGLRTESPQEVRDQVVTFTFVENNSVSVPTVGPKFDSSVDSALIARDFLNSIEALVKNGDLGEASEFLTEARSLLATFSRPGTLTRGPVKWVSKPDTVLEQQIQMAIVLSLGDK
jgi:hypothetical protein